MTLTAEVANGPPLARFDVEEVDRAADAWNFSCGPGAVCGLLEMTPEELRPHTFDFASKGLDESFTSAELSSFSGLQSIRDRVLRESGKTNPTVREFMNVSHRSRPDDALVGGPKQVADAGSDARCRPACSVVPRGSS